MTGAAPPRGGRRRLGVLGTLVLDTIRRPGRRPVEAPGGITYALAAFEARPAAGWEVLPLVKVGPDGRREADRLLERLTTVGSREGVVDVSAPDNRVELVYDGDGERTERLSGGVPGWSWRELRPLAGSCDALYVNLIAGWELELECARRLREGFPGPLYCDLHSLLLDRAEDGTRRPRVPEGWRGWFRCFDYVQINRGELELLAGEAGEDPWRLAGSLVEEGPRAVFVTLGPDGAAWVASRGDGAPARTGHGPGSGPGPSGGRSAPPRRVEAGDPTGCGDVWGMACFAALLEGAGLEAAVDRANRLAASNAASSGGAGLLEGRGSGAPRRGGVGGGGGGPAGGPERDGVEAP